MIVIKLLRKNCSIKSSVYFETTSRAFHFRFQQIIEPSHITLLLLAILIAIVPVKSNGMMTVKSLVKTL